MLQEIHKFLIEAFKHLLHEHPEGVFFYFLNTLLISIIILFHNKKFTEGLKGDDKKWQAPEIVIYIWVWMFAPSINAVLFLDKNPTSWFWLFMLGCLMFAFAGKTGLQMLFNIWGKSKIEEQIEKKDEETN